MKCQDVVRALASYANGSLKGPARQALDAHLASCEACRQAADDQTRVAALLRTRPAAPVPVGFAARLAARLDGEPGGWLGLAEWRLWALRLLPAAASLLLVAAAIPSRSNSDTAGLGLSGVVEQLVLGEREAALPAAAVFWQSNVGDESLLLTVLTSKPDGPLEDDENER